MPTGRVKWFDTVKGYGFIVPDDGGRDMFVHITAVHKAGYTNLVPGARFEGRDGALLRYRTKDSTAAIVGLGTALKSSNARLLDLRLKRPTLEDLYVQLIGEAAIEKSTPEAA